MLKTFWPTLTLGYFQIDMLTGKGINTQLHNGAVGGEIYLVTAHFFLLDRPDTTCSDNAFCCHILIFWLTIPVKIRTYMDVGDRSFTGWQRCWRWGSHTRTNSRQFAPVHFAASRIFRCRAAYPSLIHHTIELSLSTATSRVVGSQDLPVPRVWRAVLKLRLLCTASMPPLARDGTRRMCHLQPMMCSIHRSPKSRLPAIRKRWWSIWWEKLGPGSSEEAQSRHIARTDLQLRFVLETVPQQQSFGKAPASA